MPIKLVYFIILNYPLNVFSQGNSIFIEPLISALFGTKLKLIDMLIFTCTGGIVSTYSVKVVAKEESNTETK